MKTVLYLCISLNSFFVLGQKKDVAIKIHLEDNYIAKNICDAKVTPERFEITKIVGKYDKQGKFYSFTKIPEGYKIVMEYHGKYNEKGFQNTEGVLKEIKLMLYTPFWVRANAFNISQMFGKKLPLITRLFTNSKIYKWNFTNLKP